MATLIITFVLFCSNICSLVKYSVDTISSPLPSLSSSPRDSHFNGNSNAMSLPRHETFLNRATPATESGAGPSLPREPRLELVETKRSERNAAAANKATETTPLIDPKV
jgi:hypothetical protein